MRRLATRCTERANTKVSNSNIKCLVEPTETHILYMYTVARKLKYI